MSLSATVPFLAEACVSLFPADTDGSAITSAPIWMGANARNVSFDRGFEEFRMASTGANNPRVYQGNELHAVKFGRIWMLPNADSLPGQPARLLMREFRPLRNQRFVLQVVWEDPETYLKHQRIYFGVTFSQQNLKSNGVLKSDEEQIIVAEDMQESSCDC